jgi:hypothetical protein
MQSNTVKTINWDVIRSAYVLGSDYPSFDTIAKRFDIPKPLLIAKANDRADPINRGMTWLEQRDNHIDKKQKLQEDVAENEAKKSMAVIVKSLNGITVRAFKLLIRELDQLLKEQDEAIANKRPIPITRAVKMNDLSKLADTMYRLTGAAGAKEMVVKLQLAQAEHRDVSSLRDLSDEELLEAKTQIRNGGYQVIEDMSDEQPSDN